MSAHPKAKVMLNKEARKILPMLTVSMRCGCEEAERVQHYCAITLCNMLAAPLEKGLLLELVGTGAIVDLVVAAHQLCADEGDPGTRIFQLVEPRRDPRGAGHEAGHRVRHPGAQ